MIVGTIYFYHLNSHAIGEEGQRAVTIKMASLILPYICYLLNYIIGTSLGSLLNEKEKK